MFRSGRLDSLCQFEQIHHSEQTATCSHNHECIHRSSIGPTCWHRLQAFVTVVKPNSVLAPVLPKRYRFELLLEQRMVRVDYSETSILNVAVRRI